MAEGGALAVHTRNALRELVRELPGRFPHRLEALLMNADIQTQREFIDLVRNIGNEQLMRERQAGRRALTRGHW